MTGRTSVAAPQATGEVCEHCGKMLPKSKAGVPTVCSKCGQPTDAAK